MSDLHVLRVFTDSGGSHGNPLGVFTDGSAIPADDRQRVAADLGFSETVFVDDCDRGEIRIFTPAAELPFAGHPTVGTAWLLASLGHPATELHCPAGRIETWSDGALRWIRARPEWVHPIAFDQLPSAAAVEALDGPPAESGSYYAWASADEAARDVRSRYFVPELGIGEDEATGAAAVVLTSMLLRPIRILQGRGSVLHGRPGDDGTIEIGGRCVLDETRQYRVP